jgi:DNA-binding LytR/AlgR family response regulator
MNQPTAAIAEDEPHLREELRESLAQLWPELRIVGIAEDGIEALRLLETRAPDILFLDIQMPGLTGMEVAAQANGRCHIVFVTAYDQHAIAAFDQGAVDYVMKPFSVARLATAIARLKERVNAAPANLGGLLKALAAQSAGAKTWLRWINASQGANVRLITVEEICYFQADSKYTLVVTAEHESLIRKPIKELLAQLDPEMFWQIHRSTVVNVTAIAALHKTMAGNYEVRLKQRKESLPVSAPYAHLFKQM